MQEKYSPIENHKTGHTKDVPIFPIKNTARKIKNEPNITILNSKSECLLIDLLDLNNSLMAH